MFLLIDDDEYPVVEHSDAAKDAGRAQALVMKRILDFRDELIFDSHLAEARARSRYHRRIAQ